MPRNGSGTYTLPAGNPVVTGTTISSTVQNNTMSDVASALTQSLTKNGETVPTANLPMGGFKLTNLGSGSALGDSANFGQTINQPAAVTLASAATVNIGAARSSNITISGTTTITAFDNVEEGVTRTVVYSGAVPVTHNATSLILLGGASRTHAAGDVSDFKSLGSGNWKEIHFSPIGALPIANGGTGGTTAATARAALGIPLVGSLVQVAFINTTSVATGTTTIPSDNTIPQNTEGDQYMSLDITKSDGSDLYVVSIGQFTSSNGTEYFTMALFRDSVANALAASCFRIPNSQDPVAIPLVQRVSGLAAGTYTFKIRGGSQGAGTTTFNGRSGTGSYGGVSGSIMMILEVKA